MLRVVILLAYLFVAGCDTTSDQRTDARGQLPPTFVGLRTHKGMATFEEGELIIGHVHQLKQRSSTFRDMLDTLDLVPGLKILLSPSTASEDAAGMTGRTVLRPSPASFAAWTDIAVDRRHPSQDVAAIAHEFGHITEAACVGHYRSLNQLQATLRQRANEPADSRSRMPETPFAAAFTEVVMDEWAGTRQSESRFDELAMAYGLSPCRVRGRVARR